MKRAHGEVLIMKTAHQSIYKNYASCEEMFHESITSGKVMNKECKI